MHSGQERTAVGAILVCSDHQLSVLLLQELRQSQGLQRRQLRACHACSTLQQTCYQLGWQA